jgi:hypothetical protein
MGGRSCCERADRFRLLIRDALNAAVNLLRCRPGIRGVGATKGRHSRSGRAGPGSSCFRSPYREPPFAAAPTRRGARQKIRSCYPRCWVAGRLCPASRPSQDHSPRPSPMLNRFYSGPEERSTTLAGSAPRFPNRLLHRSCDATALGRARDKRVLDLQVADRVHPVGLRIVSAPNLGPSSEDQRHYRHERMHLPWQGKHSGAPPERRIYVAGCSPNAFGSPPPSGPSPRSPRPPG